MSLDQSFLDSLKIYYDLNKKYFTTKLVDITKIYLPVFKSFINFVLLFSNDSISNFRDWDLDIEFYRNEVIVRDVIIVYFLYTR